MPTASTSLSQNDVEGLIGVVADFIGVPHTRLRNCRTIDRARPYRHAIWFILHRKYGIPQRVLSRYFETSRNTIKDGIRACDTPDDAHRIALVMVKAKLNRLEIGLE